MRWRTNCALVWSARVGSAILCWGNREYLKPDCKWILGESEQDSPRDGARQRRGVWIVVTLEGATTRVAGTSMESLVAGGFQSLDLIESCRISKVLNGYLTILHKMSSDLPHVLSLLSAFPYLHIPYALHTATLKLIPPCTNVAQLT